MRYELTEQAIYTLNLVEHVLYSSGSKATCSRLPTWDADARTLYFGDYIVKQFRVPAENQVTILDAFQEENWPTQIFDPLSPQKDVDPKQRLRDTIRGLNKNQVVAKIRFSSDGTGTGIIWRCSSIVRG